LKKRNTLTALGQPGATPNGGLEGRAEVTQPAGSDKQRRERKAGGAGEWRKGREDHFCTREIMVPTERARERERERASSSEKQTERATDTDGSERNA